MEVAAADTADPEATKVAMVASEETSDMFDGNARVTPGRYVRYVIEWCEKLREEE